MSVDPAGAQPHHAVAALRERGLVYESEGAVWLRTTDFGDDKDRVMIRADGVPTYFAADAAYYLSKKDRGFDEKIYLLGADHHGYVNRLKAIAAAAGAALGLLLCAAALAGFGYLDALRVARSRAT